MFRTIKGIISLTLPTTIILLFAIDWPNDIGALLFGAALLQGLYFYFMKWNF